MAKEPQPLYTWSAKDNRQSLTYFVGIMIAVLVFLGGAYVGKMSPDRHPGPIGEVSVLLGNPDILECTVLIPVSVFEKMNQLGAYRWATECEDLVEFKYGE